MGKDITPKTRFVRAVRSLMDSAGVTFAELGAELTHRHLTPASAEIVCSDRLLSESRQDVRVTLDDLAAWERVLPGCVEAFLRAYQTGLEAVEAHGQAASPEGLQRAALEAAGASGEVLAVVARATDPASPGGAHVTTAEAAEIERAVDRARPRLATVSRTARAAAPGGVTDERILAARNKGLAR